MRICDAIVFRMISENRFQEALWTLRDMGRLSQADQLEDFMRKYILAGEFAGEAKSLGGGFTTTKIITLHPDDMEIPGITSPASLLCVWKPKPKISLFNLQSMKDGIVSNHRKEVAAYRIDKLLHLNHVPLTKSILYEECEGSVQHFVSDAVGARAMNELNLRKPRPSGKFDDSKGVRSALPRRVKLFDHLIDNRDRNLDNYLISMVDQRVIRQWKQSTARHTALPD